LKTEKSLKEMPDKSVVTEKSFDGNEGRNVLIDRKVLYRRKHLEF